MAKSVKRGKSKDPLATRAINHFELIQCSVCGAGTASPFFVAVRQGPRVLREKAFCNECLRKGAFLDM